MGRIWYKVQGVIYLGLLGIMSCGGSGSPGQSTDDRSLVALPKTEVPDFNADSAYAYVARQVSFGPRVPNTDAHINCGLWLMETMQGFADTVYIQQTRVRAYNGNVLNIKNIIGVFQPELPNRILLCAHWDSRPYADWDPDPAKHHVAIDGANDGASGVGVLMEVARQLSQHQPDTGVDIIFFDAEDYGRHIASQGADQDTWGLGSQYWARNPHRPDYTASFGILLDMVGAANATFLQEGYSMLYAPNIVRRVWDIAHKLGYNDYFIKQTGSYIVDDHYYINTIINIPTINIIHLDASTPHGFFPHWHTTGDNMDIIDKQTLAVAGQTLMALLFQ